MAEVRVDVENQGDAAVADVAVVGGVAEYLATLLSAGDLQVQQTVSEFYVGRQYAPAWTNDEGLNEAGWALYEALGDAASHGLHSVNYLPANLDALMNSTEAEDLALLELSLTEAFVDFGINVMEGRYRQGEQYGGVRIHEPNRALLQPLRYAADTGAVEEAIAAMAPTHPQYARIQEALEAYRALAAAGGWPQVPEGSNLEPGDYGNAVAALRDRLRVTGEYTVPADQVSDPNAYDQGLADAVKLFQERHGLLVDAVVGPRTFAELNTPIEDRIEQLEVGLERWRWLPRELGDRYIMVNVPGFHLTAYDASRTEQLTMRVIVGTQENQTPVFNDSMEYVQMNPYWHVPSSIATEEYLPALINDPFYLLNRNIRIYSGGSEINPILIDWASYAGRTFPYSLRQEPGVGNALGNIKFMFPNGHAVYLHDTPTQPLFQRTTRMFSHGCIRVQHPLDLAEFVLGVDPSYTRERISTLINSGRTRDISLAQTLPVYITYQTAWVGDDGSVQFRRDIYDRDSRLVSEIIASVAAASDTQIAAN